MKVALTLAYNGKDYFGSQIQKETPKTILGTLTQVLHKLSIDDKIIASGRTDKGVHASGQVCHLNLPKHWSDLERLKTVLNRMLPSSIIIKKIQKVDDDFHARYSAKKRVYRYIIKAEESNPFESDFVTFLPNAAIANIEKNIALFEGEHDFSGFMKHGSDVHSTVRCIYKAYAYRYKDYSIVYFEANGFLRSQIRLMVGALLNLDAQKIQEQLLLQKKHKIKPAPPNGLYLAKIKY